MNTEFSPEKFEEILSRSGITRGETSYVYIPKYVPRNVPPAFVEWKDRLNQGEKFPRGKYFRKKEATRRWFNAIRTHNIKFTTLYAD